MIEGRVERIEEHRVSGWAFDPEAPDAPVGVEILALGTVLGSVPADQFRADLGKAAKGDGHHAFAFTPDWSLPPWLADQIEVRATNAAGAVVLLPRITGLRPRATQDSPIIGGYDAAHPYRLHGWACDITRPDASLAISILVDACEIARIPANLPGLHPGVPGIGGSAHGFVFNSPTILPIHEPDRIQLVVAAAPGQPATLPFLPAMTPPPTAPAKPPESDLKWVKWRAGADIQSLIIEMVSRHAQHDIFFVQVGANDGLLSDPLARFVKRHHWKGLLIEPVPVFFERLQAHYAGQMGLEFIRTACAEAPRTLPFYQVRDVDNLPQPFMRGLSSLNQAVIRSHFETEELFHAFVEEVRLDVVTLDSLLVGRGIRRVDVVLVDTEGADLRVLQGFDIARYRPALVIAEHYHLPAPDREALYRLMHDAGYDRVILPMDSCFFRPSMFGHEEMDFLAAFRAPLLAWR